METLFATPHAELFLHRGASHNVLELRWLGFVNSTDLRATLTEAMRLVRQYHARGWVADNRLLRAIRPKDFDWMSVHVMTPFDQGGVHRLAVLESEDAMNQFGIRTFLSSVVPGTSITTQTFPTPEAARTWASQAY